LKGLFLLAGLFCILLINNIDTNASFYLQQYNA